MNGINLASMDSDDMVDVLHYMLEEDMFVGSQEAVESRQKTRKLIYEDMYGQRYNYGVTTKSSSTSEFDYQETYSEDGFIDSQEELIPFDPDGLKKEFTRKSYTPSTNFNSELAQPFGLKIDGPLE